MIGSLPRSTSVSTTCWQGAVRTVFGMADATRASFGNMRSLSIRPVGGCDLTRSRIARACSSRSATPSAHDMRWRVAYVLISSGKRDPLTRSNSSAGPPARITCCAIALTSRFGSTSRVMRAQLPALFQEADERRQIVPVRGDPARRRRIAPAWLPLLPSAIDITSSCPRTGARASAAPSRYGDGGSASSARAASSASASALRRARSTPPARRTSVRISAATAAGTPCSPSWPRIRRPSAGSASHASSTGSVSLPSCRSWPTDLPAVVSSIALSSTSSAIWNARPSARP